MSVKLPTGSFVVVPLGVWTLSTRALILWRWILTVRGDGHPYTRNEVRSALVSLEVQTTPAETDTALSDLVAGGFVTVTGSWPHTFTT